MEKRQRGRPTKYDPSYCDELAKLMGEGLSIGAFAGHIGVARSTINEWIEQYPEFSEAVSRAKAKRLLHWEREALRVARTGGGPGTATIIVFGLKNMGGDEWTDKVVTEHTGKDGGAIKAEALIPDDLRAALDAIAGKVTGSDSKG